MLSVIHSTIGKFSGILTFSNAVSGSLHFNVIITSLSASHLHNIITDVQRCPKGRFKKVKMASQPCDQCYTLLHALWSVDGLVQWSEIMLWIADSILYFIWCDVINNMCNQYRIKAVLCRLGEVIQTLSISFWNYFVTDVKEAAHHPFQQRFCCYFNATSVLLWLNSFPFPLLILLLFTTYFFSIPLHPGITDRIGN